MKFMNADSDLAYHVGTLLTDAGLTLAVAESCTGGWLGKVITDVPGASSYFLGGVISYADEVKVSLLNVPSDIIRTHGAVSAECAMSMAQGVCKLIGADIGISVTGVAGPGGGSEAKPVGTTYIAFAGPSFQRVEHRVWQNDRQGNREESVRLALTMLVDALAAKRET